MTHARLYRLAHILLSLICVVVWNPAQAHQQQHALSSIIISDDRAKIEVMHRFFIHDIEFVSESITNKKNTDFINDVKAQQSFGLYVQEHFELRFTGGKPLQLSYVGHEIDGKYFWVYQELKQKVESLSLELKQSALTELLDAQRNLVNVEYHSKIKSYYFSNDDWHRISFEADTAAVSF